ncbi:hypothetical protein LWI28_017606 [Acer negundo]|uniref:General transcription factor 3C polypeptide 3 n=1 Tax=Acer negundo TaxID=4023 RepID=A0AAD5IS33_ACENE|nr:hypothetical protein LWI28_017606 [Acer negundo]
MQETMDFEYDEDFEEENGEEEDVVVDEEDDEYVFRFKSGVNQLDLTENNASGLQVYQQFERLDYEALATRKRKAIAATRSEEDVASKSMYEFVEAINYRGFRRKSIKLNNTRERRKGTKNKLNPQVTRLLGEATLHYAHGRFEQAISVLNEVIRVSPNTPDSYQMLGPVYKELGDNRKTFDYHVIAAVLTRTDSSLWKQLFAWCVEKGLAFLYNNLRFCENSQEALYNVARACYHVGLVSLAATYYEKVIAMKEKDYPILRHPNKNPDLVGKQESGYCDLRTEAAYNLHLIYKKSGAVDLARQLLKDYCTF